MVSAGIDYSINYPSVVINDNGLFRFISFERKDLSKKYLFDIEHHIIEKYPDTLEDSIRLNKLIIHVLQQYGVGLVKIEGFSYMSSGSSYIDLISYQSILRYMLFESGIKLEIYSPKTVKKTAGKGNYNKMEMFDAFLNENLDNDFYKNVLKFQNEIRKNNKEGTVTDIKKPYQDLIDAYWVLKTESKINENV